jgi:hypothetical protein
MSIEGATSTEDVRHNRRRFLRQVGLALGVGVGVAAWPSVAKAFVYDCCLNNTICSGVCNPGLWYYCECPGDSFCMCSTRPPDPPCYPATC